MRPSRLAVFLVLTVSAAAWAPAPAHAQDPSGELAIFELDAALGKETTVASRRARTVRETPGVVTILEREELLATGARDLADALARVPGFQLGVDVGNTVGPGFRGVWGHEGKILFLVDGMELNDLSYGSFPLGNHVLLDQIERIEIVRGPGSALYGGHAELAVVNVVTRAATIAGAAVAATGARFGAASSAANLTAAAGESAGGLRLGAVAALGSGARGDSTYADLQGGRFDLGRGAELAPVQAVAHAAWRGLEVRALYDDYRQGARDGYAEVAPRDVSVGWRTAAVDARVAWRPSERLTLTPQVAYRWEQPWRSTAADLTDMYYDVTNQRATGRLVAEWDPLPAASVLAGAEAYVEQGRVNDFSNGLLSYGEAGRRTVTNRNAAAFLELGADTFLANVLAGARVERHSVSGTSFVPRLAVTRLLAPFHLKLLASGAFRAPSIENVNYGEGVVPERTWAFEAEAGWQVSSAVYLAANVFDLTIERPIVFGYTGTDVYTNERSTGSRGVETTLEVRRGIVSASASWSFYSARDKNRVDAYAVPGHPGLLAGFAGHKVAATAQVRPFRTLVLSPSVVFLSERYGYDHLDGAGDLAMSALGTQTTIDLFAAWGDLGTPGLEVGLGVRDLLDQGATLVQPYPGGHAPLPAGGREVMLRVRYERTGGR